MVLVIDIGNTNIKFALFKNETILHTWRLSTDTKRTGDEYYSILKPLFTDAGIDCKQIEKIVLSSVVPNLIGPFVNVSSNLIGKKPLIIGPDIYDWLPLKVPESAKYEIGTDLFCDAFEAWSKYKSACIVADFGTALSFTAISQNGSIAGVAITPGIGTAFKSLFNNTAQVPSVPLEIPPTSLGKNTKIAVQAGIVLGYKGLVEGLVKQMKDDLKKEYDTEISDIKVIATGGLNSMLHPITDIFDVTEKELTLFGMKHIGDLL
ncbi:MAG: type III pantothenate kinase [Treponema sp.]|nr:type III pantothenate kinase [Treponema sp.]